MKKILVFLSVVLMVGLPLSVDAQAVLSDSELRTTVNGGVTWLTAAQEENGHFKYEYLPYAGTYRSDDNIVRQAGAFFELGEIERMDTTGTYNLEATLHRAAEYFETISINGTHNGAAFRCVKAPKELSCKVGATALAAIGLMDFIDAYPTYEKEYGALLEDYRAYMLAMKKEDAGFRYHYYPGRKTQIDKESSFSNGEAFFALVRYEMRAHDEKTRTIIDSAFEYLDAHVPFDSALYLWAMAGVRDLNALDPDPRYIAYAGRYTVWRLEDNARYQNSAQNRCAYIEGLASARTILAASTMAPQIEREVDAMLAATLHLQIRPVNLYRYVSGALQKLKDPTQAIGGFLTGAHDEGLTERIDFTQHCLSAYAQTLVDVRGGAL